MNEMELRKIIHSGEDSGVEFKRDDVHSDSLAKEMVALLNLEGGLVLLGVEDDRRISGLTRSREDAERWVMDVARQHVQPALIPAWRTVTLEDGKAVGVIGVPADSPGKPHKAKRGSAWMAFVRVGSTSREATREEEARLYQTSHL
ncbi:MAG: AlbA family DNA-binding domain-containing protein, partial [Candidatus Binatia bacterium]